MAVNSPFVNCKVQEHLGDHDSVKHDIEDDANEDRPISTKSVRIQSLANEDEGWILT